MTPITWQAAVDDEEQFRQGRRQKKFSRGLTLSGPLPTQVVDMTCFLSFHANLDKDGTNEHCLFM